MAAPTLASQLLASFFGGSLEAFTAFATTPKFRGPTPERSPRPRSRGAGVPMTRATPKSPSRRDLHRVAVAAAKAAPAPKFPEPRRRKPHEHPHRDGNGVVTLVGRNFPRTWVGPGTGAKRVVGWSPGRRVWLAGISAQRGY